jgi:signal transduction histidine kinase
LAERFLTPQPGDPVALALALCHEVGNLLAAARLSAYLVARETERDEVLACAEDIDTATSQAGAVLAHIRPLLVGEAGVRLHVDPGEVLDAVQRSLEQHSARTPRVEIRPAPGLPDVRVDPDALHHLLVTLVLSAWDASPDETPVRLTAGVDGATVVFEVKDEGRPYEDEKIDPQVGPRGRALALQVAATLVAGWDGEVRAVPGSTGTRVELRLPAS